MNDSHWLTNYDSSNEEFWKRSGKNSMENIDHYNCGSHLIFRDFGFLYSVIVIKLPHIGFQFTDDQLFWMGAMPGLWEGF